MSKSLENNVLWLCSKCLPFAMHTLLESSHRGSSGGQWEFSKHWTHTLGFGVVLQIGLPLSVHWALVVHSSIWHGKKSYE